MKSKQAHLPKAELLSFHQEKVSQKIQSSVMAEVWLLLIITELSTLRIFYINAKGFSKWTIYRREENEC